MEAQDGQRAVRALGYWYSEQEPELPDPRGFVDDAWDEGDREMVGDYLAGGIPVEYWMGYASCRMCDLRNNGAADLTDGSYVWPEGLAHYVRDHCVRMPDEFVVHVRDLTQRTHPARRDNDWWLRQTLRGDAEAVDSLPAVAKDSIAAILRDLVAGRVPNSARWIGEYGDHGATLVAQPADNWSHRWSTVTRRDDGGWHVCLPLWTTDEAPSDLSAEFEVTKDGVVVLTGVHVL